MSSKNKTNNDQVIQPVVFSIKCPDHYDGTLYCSILDPLIIKKIEKFIEAPLTQDQLDYLADGQAIELNLKSDLEMEYLDLTSDEYPDVVIYPKGIFEFLQKIWADFEITNNNSVKTLTENYLSPPDQSNSNWSLRFYCNSVDLDANDFYSLCGARNGLKNSKYETPSELPLRATMPKLQARSSTSKPFLIRRPIISIDSEAHRTEARSVAKRRVLEAFLNDPFNTKSLSDIFEIKPSKNLLIELPPFEYFREIETKYHEIQDPIALKVLELYCHELTPRQMIEPLFQFFGRRFSETKILNIQNSSIKTLGIKPIPRNSKHTKKDLDYGT